MVIKNLGIIPISNIRRAYTIIWKLYFNISFDAPNIKLNNNAFYSSWASFADFVSDELILCYDKAQNVKDFNKKILLALSANPDMHYPTGSI